MVKYEDMTEEERDRFIYLMLSENDLKAIVLLMKKKYGDDVSIDKIMRFAFKVAQYKLVPKKIREEINKRGNTKEKR